jgi:hypothetical protein
MIKFFHKFNIKQLNFHRSFECHCYFQILKSLYSNKSYFLNQNKYLINQMIVF